MAAHIININATIAISILLIGYIYIIFKFIKERDELEEDIRYLKDENLILKYKLEQYTTTPLSHKTKLKYNKNDNDLLDAVKFAMAKAHPDNPDGSKDRFIKYRKIYEQLKG